MRRVGSCTGLGIIEGKLVSQIVKMYPSVRVALRVAKFMLQGLYDNETQRPLIKSYVLKNVFLHVMSYICDVGIKSDAAQLLLHDSAALLMCLFDIILQPIIDAQEQATKSVNSENFLFYIYHPFIKNHSELPFSSSQTVDPLRTTITTAFKKLMCLFLYRAFNDLPFKTNENILPPFSVRMDSCFVPNIDLRSDVPPMDASLQKRSEKAFSNPLDDVTGFCFGVDVDVLASIGKKIYDRE